MVETCLIREIFSVSDLECIEDLSQIAQVRHFVQGEMIYEIGKIQKNIYILLRGIVYSYFIDETQTMITDCFLGDRGFPINTENFELPSMFGTQALVDVELLEVPIADALGLMQKHTVLAWEYIRFMQMGLTFHWYIANKRIHYPARKRYEWFRETWPEADRVASNYQIASFLGIRSESLSRLRQQMKKEESSKAEDADILVTRDLKWNYDEMKKAVKHGQYKKKTSQI